MRRSVLVGAATAWVGIVFGHLAAYLVAYPAEPVREMHLALAGHGWMEVGALLALAVIPAILLVTGIRAARLEPSAPLGRTALRLAAFQLPAFVLIELSERHFSLGLMLTDRAVLAGLAAQVVVSLVAAAVLTLVARGVRAVVSRRRPAPSPRPVRIPAPAQRVLASRAPFLLGPPRRAPPPPLAA
ncbi:MAG: hypothetical protein ACRDIZ_02070 [Actinomycetota bacterium]